MSEDSFQEMPWVIFSLQDQCYAVSSAVVREMMALPNITPVPRSPDFVRGMINLRGSVMPLIDLRKRLNLKTSLEELEDFVEVLNQRELDHKNWLAELEASIKEKRGFSLTTDPHKCAFGKWFDQFTSEDAQLMGIIARFDRPHQRIHAIGIKVEQLANESDFEGALRVIEDTREGDLAHMIYLFEEVRQAVRRNHTEIVLVLEETGVNLALAVDAVESVEQLLPGTVEEIPSVSKGTRAPILTKIGRRQQDNEGVLIVDVGRLVQEGEQIPSE